MAKELSQEEVLDFLCQGGGKVPNASLVGHFKRFLRDPQSPAEQLLKHRERFKRYVNSVAVVKQEGAVKYVVLRSRYRDLLGEDLRAPTPEELGQQEESVFNDNREVGRIVPAVVQGAQVGGGCSSQAIVRQVQGDVYYKHDSVHPETFLHTPQLIAITSNAPYDSGGVIESLNGKILEDSSYIGPYYTSPCVISSPPSPENSTSLVSTNASMPSNKTLRPETDIFPQAQISNTSKSSNKNFSPPSNSPSSVIKPYSPMNSLSSPHHNQSSFSSSVESSATAESSSPASSGHRRYTPEVKCNAGQAGEVIRERTTVGVSCMAPEGQKPVSFTCSELQTPNCYINNTFQQEVDEEHYMHNQHQIYSFYTEQPASPSSRRINPTHPALSLLLPQESSCNPPDVLLPDYQTNSSPPFPLPLNDMHGMWMCQMPVFKSIRSQLSLQDMEDFVDQDSCGSEGSDSGEGGDCDTEHRDEEEPSSDSNNEKFTHYIEKKCESIRRCPPNRKFLSIVEQYDKLQSGEPMDVTNTLIECGIEPNVKTESRESPYTAKSFLTDQAPILFELAVNPPRHRMSSRLQEIMSSSDDELIDRDYKKRRRPSRAKRPSNIVLVPPKPDVDNILTTRPVSSNHFIVSNSVAIQKPFLAQHVPKVDQNAVFKMSFTYKTSTVPLDPVEHDWIVKSASASWLHVYGLFIEDPNLALQKDFISGYTALHWFAKHGSIEMFNKFVDGAKKAGIELDLNLKSHGGYTPLHIAAIHGHHKVAAMLVEKLKVNVKLRDNSGKRAWQYLGSNTSGEVWQLLGAPKGKTIFASRALNTTYNFNIHNTSSQLNRKTSLAAFLKPQHQKWKANNYAMLREREIYSD